jgi:hypothetical protein
MSDPKLWLRTDSRFTEVHTPFTTRAKELMDIYNGIYLFIFLYIFFLLLHKNRFKDEKTYH